MSHEVNTRKSSFHTKRAKFCHRSPNKPPLTFPWQNVPSPSCNGGWEKLRWFFSKPSSLHNHIFFSSNATDEAGTPHRSLDAILGGKVFGARCENQECCFEHIKLDMTITPECSSQLGARTGLRAAQWGHQGP